MKILNNLCYTIAKPVNIFQKVWENFKDAVTADTSYMYRTLY